MQTSPKIHYGWIVVGITCLVLLTSAGIRSTPGILMVPLENEFHWSRATIALAVSITNGQGAMPSFADSLSEQEIADVAAYVSESTR